MEVIRGEHPIDMLRLWRFADQRGGPIYKFCRSGAKWCQAFPKSAHYLLITLKILLNSSPNLPNLSQNLPKFLPRSIQNRSRSPLGPHLGPMRGKSLISNAQKTAKKRPSAPRRGPRSSQIPPKWSPRPSQNWFLDFFRARNSQRFFIDFL